MRQLQLFTSAALAEMRDRTASRNHSPERDEFRREHERHRAWGLAQRHGMRLRRLRNRSCASQAASIDEPAPQRETPADAALPTQKDQPALAGQGNIKRNAEPPRALAQATDRRPPARSPLHPSTGSTKPPRPHSPTRPRTFRMPRPTFRPRFSAPTGALIRVASRSASLRTDTPPRRVGNARASPQRNWSLEAGADGGDALGVEAQPVRREGGHPRRSACPRR